MLYIVNCVFKEEVNMGKNVLIISTSLRNGSNSEVLAKETEKGAKDADHNVEFVSLKEKNIQFCKGCLACQKLKHCVIDDDANVITEKMLNADVIVWATPVYYYEMSGQMKTIIDRANPLFASNYKFREVYLITTSADGDDAIQPVINGLNGWIACFNGVKLCGYISGGELNSPAEINNNEKLLEKAYNLGKSI